MAGATRAKLDQLAPGSYRLDDDLVLVKIRTALPAMIPRDVENNLRDLLGQALGDLGGVTVRRSCLRNEPPETLGDYPQLGGIKALEIQADLGYVNFHRVRALNQF